MSRFFIGLLIILILSGCAQQQKFTYQGEKGGTLIIATFDEPSNLSPVYPSFTGLSPVVKLLFAPLHKTGPDGKVMPCLANSWEYSEDMKTITYYLDRNAKWSDGTPLTAKDVVATFEALKDPANQYPLIGRLRFIKSAKVVGEHAVQFEFRRIYADELLNSNLYPLPAGKIKGIKNLKFMNYTRKPDITSGPYILNEWNPGKYIELIANENYIYGRPPIDRIVFWFPASYDELLDELKQKHVDIVLDVPPDRVEKLDGYNVKVEPGQSYVFVGWNNKKFKKALRQAFSMAIDKKSIIKDVLKGYGQEAYGPITPGHWAYEPEVKNIAYAYSPKKAKDLIASQGYRDRNRDRFFDGLRVEIIADKNDPVKSATADLVAKQLRKAGVRAVVRKLDTPAFISRLLKKDFDAFILGWNVEKEFSPSPIWNSRGVYNFVGYKNTDIDMLIERGILTLDRRESKKIWSEFQKRIVEDAPYTFLYVPSVIELVRSGIKNVDVKDARLLAEKLDELWIPATTRVKVTVADLGKRYRESQKKAARPAAPAPRRTPTATAESILQQSLLAQQQAEAQKTEQKTGKPSQGEAKKPEGEKKPPEETKPAEEKPTQPVIKTLPQVKNGIIPVYPDVAKRVGATGMVFVTVLVGKDGKVKKAKILRSFGNAACDKAALDAAKKWTFIPGTINGEPVEMETTIPFRFPPPEE